MYGVVGKKRGNENKEKQSLRSVREGRKGCRQHDARKKDATFLVFCGLGS